MFKNILVATDLSSASDQMVNCMHGLRPLGVERIILTHALGIRHLEEMKNLLIPLVEPRLLLQKRSLESQGFSVEVAIAPGIPAFEIHRVAGEKNAELIVVGSHGMSMARGVLLGSVTHEVINRTELPVFIAHIVAADEDALRCEMICADFRLHVLFATDFSDISERAFTFVEKFVRSGGRKVTLLHVQNRNHISPDRIEEFSVLDRERMTRMAKQLKELGAEEVNLELPYGAPKQEIVKCIEQDGFSLVIMGTQGRGFFGEFFIGSVAYHIARRALTPTLLIPPLR